jgi:carotenoid cleavage dioxygenase
MFGEPVFAPRSMNAAEAEGYLLMLANDLETSLTELMVFDALDIQSGPRCRANLPVRIPAGFHGTWVGTD